MTRITIVKDDSWVGIDGEFYKVDCSDLPSNFHALQWYNDTGEVEWKGNPRPQNTIISSLAQYQNYIDRWNVAKQEYQNQMALLAAQMAAQQAQLNSNTSSNTA